MKYLLIPFAFFLSETAIAQERNRANAQMEMCQGQVALYCSEEQKTSDAREILKCLIRNDEKLSTECKQEVQRFIQAARQTTPPGSGPLGALGGVTGLGSQVPSLSYNGLFSPSPNGDPNTPSIIENSLSISTPIFKTESDTVAISLNGSDLHFSEAIVLDNTRVVPNHLYRAEAGLQYSHRLLGQRTIGVRGSLGYTGDKISNSTESFSISANYSFSSSRESHWVLMVMMSNNSPLGTFVPIPGFFYVYRTEKFTGVFGLPILSMQWTPVIPWSFSLSAFGPLIKSEVAYGAIDKTQFFAGLAWKQQRYILSERTNEKERLTIEEKNTEVGVRRPLFPGLHSEIQVGYSFDRSTYLGEGLFDKGGGRAGLESNWYLRWSLKFAF